MQTHLPNSIWCWNLPEDLLLLLFRQLNTRDQRNFAASCSNTKTVFYQMCLNSSLLIDETVILDASQGEDFFLNVTGLEFLNQIQKKKILFRSSSWLPRLPNLCYLYYVLDCINQANPTELIFINFPFIELPSSKKIFHSVINLSILFDQSVLECHLMEQYGIFSLDWSRYVVNIYQLAPLFPNIESLKTVKVSFQHFGKSTFDSLKELDVCGVVDKQWTMCGRSSVNFHLQEKYLEQMITALPSLNYFNLNHVEENSVTQLLNSKKMIDYLKKSQTEKDTKQAWLTHSSSSEDNPSNDPKEDSVDEGLSHRYPEDDLTKLFNFFQTKTTLPFYFNHQIYVPKPENDDNMKTDQT